jgi:hypothetical protein
MTIEEAIEELKKYPKKHKLCFDTEGKHESCFVEVDYIFGEYCVNHGFVGMGTKASHSKVTNCCKDHIDEIIRNQRVGDPKDFPNDIFSDRNFKQGSIVNEIDRKIKQLKEIKNKINQLKVIDIKIGDKVKFKINDFEGIGIVQVICGNELHLENGIHNSYIIEKKNVIEVIN